MVFTMAGGRNSLGPRGFLTEEEKQNMPKVTKGLLLRIFSYLKPYWLQFIFVFIAILLSATVGLFPSIITGKIVDQALVGKDMKLLVQLLLTAFATVAVSQLIGVLENYINSWISQRIIYDMKNQMYHHLQYMPHSFFTSEKQGDIITRMNTDISGVSSVISGTLSSIVSNIATCVTTLVALLSMNWKLALVGIVVIPLLILPSRSAGKKRYELLTGSVEIVGTVVDEQRMILKMNGDSQTFLNSQTNFFAGCPMTDYVLATRYDADGKADYLFKGRLYYLRFFDHTGTMVRSFIPCYRKSDGEIGLYDFCGSICPQTGTPFYVNLGENTFSKGADVVGGYVKKIHRNGVLFWEESE